MTRPHEDLERHTPTDHRPGGVPVTFAPGTWCAIDIAHVKADRGLSERAASNRFNHPTRVNPCPTARRAAIEAALRHFGMV